jgi:hypothetical protein
MLMAPSVSAPASETSTRPRSSSGDVPFFLSVALSWPVRPAGWRPWGAGPLRHGRPALPVHGDLQGMIPLVMVHGKERSRLDDCMVVVIRNLPGTERFSPLNARTRRPLSGRTFSSRDTRIAPAPVRCAARPPLGGTATHTYRRTVKPDSSPSTLNPGNQPLAVAPTRCSPQDQPDCSP